MAQRLQFNISDKSSLTPSVSGAALTSELANIAFPESSQKRWNFHYFTSGNAPTVGATATELFIGGTNSFRLRPAADSVMNVQISGVYHPTLLANCTSFSMNVTLVNKGGTVTVLADSTNVKQPLASTATLTPTVLAGNLILTAVGVAVDTNGRWAARATVTEITDIG